MPHVTSRIRLICLATTILVASAHALGDADTRVRIDSGIIEGAREDGVTSYKGVPYAATPVGELRWRAPQPVSSWSGVRETTQYGNDCVQQPIPGDAGAGGSTRAEDCLVLNVWRPAGSAAALPVMVWIHGGGFVNGAASVPFFDGGAFARSGVVLVSFNYRLGRLGFFAHPALSAAQKGEPLGNYALLDQLAALQWVERNIAAFGGDPDQVTIAGESAGGISVVHLLTWPKARGLFDRAIVMSGGGRSYLMQHRKLKEARGELPSAEHSGLEFARSVGVNDEGLAGLKALRALPAERITGDMSMAALFSLPPTYAGGPIEDGEVVTAQPEEHLRRDEFAKVPLIIGTVGDDVAGDFPPDRAQPLEFFGEDAPRARELYDPQGNLSPQQLVALIGADMSMHEPARFVARRMHAASSPAWLYRFDYVLDAEKPQRSSAAHASELPYLFNQLGARYGERVSRRDRKAARALHTYVVNFVKSGDPNGARKKWTAFEPASSQIMMFSGDGKVQMQADPLYERLQLVERARARLALQADAAR